MGLILIDRQEMAAKYDQLSQVYAQNKEILKREQAAHLNAIYEYEKREERIRKALCIEKQHVADVCYYCLCIYLSPDYTSYVRALLMSFCLCFLFVFFPMLV
jgi:hypothetical protein